jgi:hypothetical protein
MKKFLIFFSATIVIYVMGYFIIRKVCDSSRGKLLIGGQIGRVYDLDNSRWLRIYFPLFYLDQWMTKRPIIVHMNGDDHMAESNPNGEFKLSDTLHD